jgi:hypothetical protein
VAGAAAAHLRAAALVPPPVISLNLGESDFVHETKLDKNGVPCNSFAAHAASCETASDDAPKRFYKFCYVNKDTAQTCALPIANAHDHNEGEIEVVRKVFLHVKSDKHKGPVVVNNQQADLDYNQRGEYYLTYDAEDSSGNKATTIKFTVFMVDHEPPTIHSPSVTPETPKSGVFLVLPITASDTYDGEVTDVVKVQLTHPDGQEETLSMISEDAVRVDTTKHGKWSLKVTARDFASAFGKDYHDNEASLAGHVVITDGSITEVKFGEQVTTYKPKPAPPVLPPLPELGPVTVAPHARHYVPPVLMLHLGGNVVARGSPFGVHRTEQKYRAHLQSKGLSQKLVDDHVAMIVAREERLAAKLGAKAVWHGGRTITASELFTLSHSLDYKH